MAELAEAALSTRMSLDNTTAQDVPTDSVAGSEGSGQDWQVQYV